MVLIENFPFTNFDREVSSIALQWPSDRLLETFNEDMVKGKRIKDRCVCLEGCEE